MLNHFFKKQFIVPIGTLSALIMVLVGFYFARAADPEIALRGEGGEYIISLRDDGFYPPQLTIGKGDVVQFVNLSSRPFWPASNIHPTHTIYSEFDPRDPLEPTESWSFQFNRSGEWKYHDHLAPFAGGVILVGARVGDETCEGVQCWETMIDSIIAKDNLGAVFDHLSYLYETDPSFVPRCHDMTHYVGEVAYKMYARGEDFDLTPKSAFCSYGFYHGFMENIVYGGGGSDEARALCKRVFDELHETAPDAFLQCYHGIGHGALDIYDPANWGNEQAMIEPALRFCEEAADSSLQFSRCATGVYNTIAFFYIAGDYGLAINKEDPFWICREQSAEYQDACYISLNVALMWMVNSNFAEAMKFVEDIPDDTYAQHATINLASPLALANITADDHTDSIAACRALQERLRPACFQGFAFGFLFNGASIA